MNVRKKFYPLVLLNPVTFSDELGSFEEAWIGNGGKDLPTGTGDVIVCA